MSLERGDSPLAGRRPAPLKGLNSIGTPLSALHSPPSATSLQGLPLPPLGGLSTSLQSPTGATLRSPQLHAAQMSGGGGGVSAGSGEPTVFRHELHDVEQWFDRLDARERVALVSALATRSSEPQLRQFATIIDDALGASASTAGAAPGAPSGPKPAGSSCDGNNIGSGGNAGNGSVGNAGNGSGNANNISNSGNGNGGNGSGNGNGNGSNNGGSSSSSGAKRFDSRFRAPLSAGTPLGAVRGEKDKDGAGTNIVAPAGGIQSGLSGLGSAGGLAEPKSGGSSYAHMFPTLGYSPWGTEIGRPSSSAADAWSDKSRGSPTAPHSECEAAPVGMKPWRSFKPQNAPPSSGGTGIGQAPERSLLYSYRLYGSSLHLNGGAAAGGAASSGNSGFSHSYSAHSAPSSAVYPYFSAAQSVQGTVAVGGDAPTKPPGASAVSGSGSGTLPGSVAGSVADVPPKPAANAEPETPAASASAASAAVPASGTHASAVQSGGAGGAAAGGAAAAAAAVPSGAPASAPSSVHGTPTRARRNVNVVDVELLSDIGAWLRSLRLHKYTGNLSGMRWQEVIQLSDEDLENRGVNALGARRKLLKMFQEIKQAQEEGLLK